MLKRIVFIVNGVCGLYVLLLNHKFDVAKLHRDEGDCVISKSGDVTRCHEMVKNGW
jgi:uncharacterized membrane protein YuzA (DUF378 family)